MARRRALLTAALALAALPATAGAATPGAPAPGTPGALVPSFGAAAPPQTAGVVLGPADSAYSAVVAHGDGFLVAGQEGAAGGPRLIVARYLRDGRLDPGFGDGGIARGPVSFSGPAAGATNSSGSGIALQSDGRIVVGGTLLQGSSPVGLLAERFTADGRLDTSYGSGGVAVAQRAASSRGAALALTPDGRAVVAGTSRLDDGSDAATVARWNASGQPDPSFDGDGVWQHPSRGANTASSIAAVAVAADGSLTIGGQTTNAYGAREAATGRLSASGAIESWFGGGPYPRNSAFSTVAAVAVRADGRTIAVGQSGFQSSAEWFASINGAVTWGPAALPSATALNNPLPGANAVVSTAHTVYVGGTAEGSQYRVMSLTALDAISGAPLAGFGSPLGTDFPAFASAPGTTYAFVDGASDTPTNGPGSSLRGIARTSDGRYVAGVGVAGSFLGGPAPTTTRGVIALFMAVPEPLAPEPGDPGSGGGTGDGTSGDGGGGGGGGTVGPGRGPSAVRITAARLSPRALLSRTRAQLRFSVSAAATVTLTVEHLRSGRRQTSGRPSRTVCAAPSRRNARGRRCTRAVGIRGRVRFRTAAGAQRRTITRRLLGRALPRGRYRLLVRATVPGAPASRRVLLPFEVR